mgnify:CR=1 FL=1
MKTQIIALDKLEDHLSVRDKLNWSQTGRVLLTWVDNRRLLTRLDLVLIQRYCAARSVQLGLVTRNPEIRAEAAELGIPAFDTTRQAQTARWRTSRRRRLPRKPKSEKPDLATLREQAHPQPPAWTQHLAVRLAAFIVGLLAVLALLLYLLPGARVVLTPRTQAQNLELTISANPQAPQAMPGILSTYAITVVVEGRASLPASGSVRVPYQPARGEIRFTNLTEQPVVVPKGSVVCTLDSPTLRFSTDKAGTVPAGLGRTLTLPITALLPGPGGNLPAGRIAAVEGPLGLQLSAANLTATRFGSDGPVTAPTALDQQKLLEQLTTELHLSALEEMQAMLPAGDQALPPTLELVDTLEEVYNPPSGQPGKQLELTLRLEFSGQAVSAAHLRLFAQPLLDAELPQGFTPLDGSLEITPTSTPAADAQGNYTWRILARRSLQAEITTSKAIALLLGRPLDQARQTLVQKLPLDGAPRIQVTPDWWPRLPLAAFRIQLVAGELP